MKKKQILRYGMIAIATSLLFSGFLLKKANAWTIDENIMKMELDKASIAGNVYVVSQDGTGDFTSIQEGVNNAESGDSLLIYPGTYHEAVSIDNKTVNLIGTQKANCIIEYDTQSYYAVPLNIAAGNVCNLTIHGTGNGDRMDGTAYNLADWESITASNFSGYAVHVESNYSFEKDLRFQNCDIISDSNYCIGMGTRGGMKISFEGCQMISRGEAGCVYMHDASNEDFGGEAKIIFSNCVMKNYICPYVFSMYSLHGSNCNLLTFQNVHVSTVAYEKKSIYNDNTAYDFVGVDILRELCKNNILQGSYYKSTLGNNLVHILTKEESLKYITETNNSKPSELEAKVNLAEGITYILRTETDKESNEKEESEIVHNRIRSVINTWNLENSEIHGWCGLNNTFLTNDSCNNTLVEMNY